MKGVIEKVRDNVSHYKLPDGSPMFVHAVTVNGSEAMYHSKSEQCVKFVAGQEAHFDLKDVETKMGVQKRIVPIQAPNSGGFNKFGGGGGAKKSYGQPKNENRITYLSCLSSVCVLYQQSSKGNDFEYILAMAEKAYQSALGHND